jgi:hypothetical protein
MSKGSIEGIKKAVSFYEEVFKEPNEKPYTT